MFATLIIIVHRVINNIAMHKKYNQVADQIDFYSKIGVRYISNNYIAINNNVKSNGSYVVPASMLQTAGYIPLGHTATNFYRQKPCLWITKYDGVDSQLRAYLLFTNSIQSKNLTHLDAANIADNIGGAAGFLDPDLSGMIIKGKMFNSYLINKADINLIEQNCGGILAANSIVVNLNAHKDFFAQLRNAANGASDDNTLKKSYVGNIAANTMQTNLYLDNTIKEASTTKKLYCDANQMPFSDADLFCKSIGSSQGWIYVGNPKWINYVQHDDQCIYNAEAMFSTRSYICDATKFSVTADSMCRNNLSDYAKYYSAPAAFWNVGYVAGEQCVGNKAFGYFDWMPCFGAEGRSDYWINVSNAAHAHGCSDYSGPFHPSFYYSRTTDRCVAGPDSWECRGANYFVSGTASVRDYNSENLSLLQCGITKVFPASPVDSQPNVRSCGSKTYPAFEAKIINPAQHAYRKIDFGNGPKIDGQSQRIQIAPDAAGGIFVNQSKLNISGAGIKAGIIAPNSHTIQLGELCSATELGNIAQELVSDTSGVSGGQLQCAYNIVHCTKDPYYCYLPTKSATINYVFKTPKSSWTCPKNTIVDSNQSAQAVSTNSSLCITPEPLGGGCLWLLSRGPYGMISNCNTTINQLSVCHTYLSLCDYRNSCNPAAVTSTTAEAILSTSCTAASANFIINNYKNPG